MDEPQSLLLLTLLALVAGQNIWEEVRAWLFRRQLKRITEQYEAWERMAEDVQLSDIRKWLEENDT